MVENQSIKSIVIPEMGLRLGCSSECICLSLYTNHRFFDERNTSVTQYDVFAIGATCLLMASKRHEKPLDVHDIVNVLISTIHQISDCSFISPEQHERWKLSILQLETFIARNISFRIGYIQSSLSDQISSNANALGLLSNSDTTTIRNSNVTSGDKNIKSTVPSHYSAHKFLVHFLISLNDWLNDVDPTNDRLKELGNAVSYKVQLNNLAWCYLNDFFWSSRVIKYRQDYLACASIEMALKTLRINIPGQQKARKLWFQVFCNDLTQKELDRIINIMIDEYTKYDLLIELELKTSVIDSLIDDSI